MEKLILSKYGEHRFGIIVKNSLSFVHDKSSVICFVYTDLYIASI